MYGEGVVTDRMCQKWFVKVSARDFSLDNAPWLDRLVEVISDEIWTLIENNQCCLLYTSDAADDWLVV